MKKMYKSSILLYGDNTFVEGPCMEATPGFAGDRKKGLQPRLASIYEFTQKIHDIMTLGFYEVIPGRWRKVVAVKVYDETGRPLSLKFGDNQMGDKLYE